MAKSKHLEKAAILRLSVFGVATVAFAALSIFGLINNSQGAVERYEALKAVDQAGGDVEASLNELRTYIYGHMNTQIGSELGLKPPIQLSGTYNRLVEAERERVSRINSTLEPQAIAYCEAQNPTGFSGRHRIDCIEQYKDENGAKEQPIEDDFYKFDFAPPFWSPDLAGFSILAAIVCGLAFVIQLVLYLRVRHVVHYGN